MKHLKFKNLLLLVAITAGLASCGGNNSNTSSSTSNSGGGETPISLFIQVQCSCNWKQFIQYNSSKVCKAN